MDNRFKFRVWEVKKNKYREASRNIADNCIDYLEGKVLYGEGIEIYGEEDDKDVILEQCTGLKDKNGKLIYEGDILKSRYSDIMRYEVVYRNAGLELRVYSIGHKETMGYLHIGEDAESIGLYEVISNIHENPELLEDK